MKFFEPTVSATPLLSGFSSIAVELVSVPVSPESSSSSSPQAATASASTSAASKANSPLYRAVELILG